MGDKGANESGLVLIAELMGRRGDEENGDVRDGAVISNGVESADGGLLEGEGEQATKDPLDGGSAGVMVLEDRGSVRDLISGIVGETPEVIAAFLQGKFGMIGGAKQHRRTGSLKEGAAVLEVSLAFDRHAAVAVHREISGTEDLLGFAAKAVLVGDATAITGDEGLSFELLEDVGKYGFDIVFGISTDRVDGQREGLDGGLEQRNCHPGFGDGIGFGHFPKGQFGGQVGQGMVAIAPEVGELRRTGVGVVDPDAETSIGVPLGRQGFVPASAVQGGFEIVFPNPTGNRTGVQTEMDPRNHARGKQLSGELNANLLQQSVGTISQEGAETLQTGRLPMGVESQGSKQGRTLLELGVQIPEKALSGQPLINAGLEQALSIDGTTSGGSRSLRPRGQKLKQPLPSQPKRQLLRRNQLGLSHCPEFCES